MWLGSKFTSLSDSLFRSLFKFLFRYDIFISYARTDGKEYALKLRDQLKHLDFSCFLDVDELPAGNSLNSTLKRAIRRSATLVVVGTQRATKSRYVELEVGEFAGTGRAVIPIDIEGTLAEAPWGVLKERDLVWIDEARAALERGTPSPNVADSIDKLFKYTRRNSRVRAQVLSTILLFVLIVVGSLFAIRQEVLAANVATTEAERQKVEASNQKSAAEEASRRAEIAKAEAVQAQADARKAQADAEKSQAKATTAEKAAQDATKEAKRQEALALANAATAKRQQQIAEERTNYVRAQQIGVQADIDVDKGNNLERSVLLSVESLKRAGTPDGYAAWARGMDLLPRTDEPKFADREDKVSAVAYSLDGRFFAQGTKDGGVTFFRTDGTAEPVKKQLGGEVRTIAFGENWVAAVNRNGFVMWDLKGFGELRSSKTLHAFRGDSVAFSPDGRYVAAGGAMTKEWLGVFDTVTGARVIQKRVEHVGYVMSVAFSPDGKWLAVGSHYKKYEEAQSDESDSGESESKESKPAASVAEVSGSRPTVGRVLFWDVASFAKDAEPEPAGWVDEENSTYRAIFSPKGNYLATEDDKGGVRLWNVYVGDDGRLQLKRTDAQGIRGSGLSFPNYGKATLVFSPDESYITTVTDKNIARVWDAGTGREVSRVMNDKEVESIAFSPAGQFATASGEVAFWKTQFGSEAERLARDDKTPEADVKAVAAGGEWLVTADADGARVFRTTDWSLVRTLKEVGHVSKLLFSSDGRWLVAGGEDKVTVFETGRWEVRKEILPSGEQSTLEPTVGFGPNDRWLVIESRGLVRLFEVGGSWREIQAIPQDRIVDGVAFSSDGRRLAALVKGDYIDEGTTGHGRRPRKPSEVRFWDTSDWTPAPCRADVGEDAQFENDMLSAVWTDAVCADVKGTGREVTLSEVHKWKETPGDAHGSGASKDGLWSVENDNGVRLLYHEEKTKRQVAALMPGGSPGDWAFTPDNHWLIVSGQRGVGLWPLEPARMIDAACSRLRRHDLTADERKLYISDGGTQPTCASAH